MGKWCLHASLFIFDQNIRKVAGNQDRHKCSVEFYFGPDQTTHFGVTCFWVTKISHFWTWISLKPVGQSWSNFMSSIIGVGERLHKVLGQIDLGTLDSGERSLPFGLLVFYQILMKLADNLSRHKISRVFKIWPEWTVYFGVTCLVCWKPSGHVGLWWAIVALWTTRLVTWLTSFSGYEKLFSHMSKIQGTLETKQAFIKEIIHEAGRFKKKVLIQLLEQFEKTLIQNDKHSRLSSTNSSKNFTRWQRLDNFRYFIRI